MKEPKKRLRCHRDDCLHQVTGVDPLSTLQALMDHELWHQQPDLAHFLVDTPKAPTTEVARG